MNNSTLLSALGLWFHNCHYFAANFYQSFHFLVFLHCGKGVCTGYIFKCIGMLLFIMYKHLVLFRSNHTLGGGR